MASPQKVTIEAFMANGPHIVDSNAVLESGLIISHANRWAFLATQPTPVYALRGRGMRPIRKRASYIVQKAPPSPMMSAHLQRRYGALDTVRERSALGLNYTAVRGKQRNKFVQIGASLVGGLAMCLALFLSIQGDGQGLDFGGGDTSPQTPSQDTLPEDFFNPTTPEPTPIFQFDPEPTLPSDTPPPTTPLDLDNETGPISEE